MCAGKSPLFRVPRSHGSMCSLCWGSSNREIHFKTEIGSHTSIPKEGLHHAYCPLELTRSDAHVLLSDLSLLEIGG